MEYNFECQSKNTKSMYETPDVFCNCMKELNKTGRVIFGDKWNHVRYNKFFDYHREKYKQYQKNKNDILNMYNNYMDNS